MCAYPLPLSASAFSSSPPRFLQVMRGEETNERKEGKEREREREMCALLVPQKGKGGHTHKCFPLLLFFSLCGKSEPPSSFPPLFPPPRLLHYFPCMDSFSSFPPLLSVVVFCLGSFFLLWPAAAAAEAKKEAPPSPFLHPFFSVLPHFDVSRFFFS